MRLLWFDPDPSSPIQLRQIDIKSTYSHFVTFQLILKHCIKLRFLPIFLDVFYKHRFPRVVKDHGTPVVGSTIKFHIFDVALSSVKDQKVHERV